MKYLPVLLFFICNAINAQQPLYLSTDKTTSLIFPYPVKYVDRGTEHVLVQALKENENLLLVKAASKKFNETNLSVITEDGQIYQFKVNYQDQPSELVIHVPVQQQASIRSYANAILDNPSKRLQKIERSGVTVHLAGIYIKNDHLYYHFQLHNHSRLDYSVELLEFSLKDLKRSKRTSVQDILLKPLLIAGNSKIIRARQSSVIVVAFEKFTIPKTQYLGLQLLEKNGGRDFEVKIKARHVWKSKELTDLY